MELREHKKPLIEDQEITDNVRKEDLSQRVLSHVYAVEKVFEKVSFKQSEVSNAYFRNCTFINCNFTGATISKSNLRGSTFDGCDFRYCIIEKTFLDESFLDRCLPSEENLARDLARTLRVNFSQTGNYEAVNKAASIEVSLTGQHLFNVAYSKQSHYRRKHKGWERVIYGLKHAKWKALDILWGNGESILKIIVSAMALIVLSALVLSAAQPQLSFFNSLLAVGSAFWGVKTGIAMLDSYLVLLTIARFCFFGLFMAVLIKRLSRR